jgi:hypothetical protein
MRNDLAERITGRVQEIPQTQAVDNGIVDVEQQLVTVALGFGGGEEVFILPRSASIYPRPGIVAHGELSPQYQRQRGAVII